MHGYATTGAIYGAAAGGAVLALAAAFWAGQRERLFVSDLGAVLGAPILFVLVAGARNVAIAGIVWPIAAAVLLMYAFAAKVFILDRAGRPKRNSRVLLYVALTGCLFAAILVPAWYE